MAKKRQQRQAKPTNKERENSTLSDALGEDILEKLKATKKELAAAESAKEEERQAQLQFERNEREKNKSFEELLNDYGDAGSKF